METLLVPPVAFGIYLLLVGIMAGGGRLLAGPGKPTAMKASLYASGEVHDARPAVPGYRPFFIIALFFALLHLGVLLLACGGQNAIALLYALGLMLALVALILG